MSFVRPPEMLAVMHLPEELMEMIRDHEVDHKEGAEFALERARYVLEEASNSPRVGEISKAKACVDDFVNFKLESYKDPDDEDRAMLYSAFVYDLRTRVNRLIGR